MFWRRTVACGLCFIPGPRKRRGYEAPAGGDGSTERRLRGVEGGANGGQGKARQGAGTVRQTRAAGQWLINDNFKRASSPPLVTLCV